MWGWPIAGLLACDLYLVLECTCLWHQSDQLYLFLAKNLFYCIMTVWILLRSIFYKDRLDIILCKDRLDIIFYKDRLDIILCKNHLDIILYKDRLDITLKCRPSFHFATEWFWLISIFLITLMGCFGDKLLGIRVRYMRYMFYVQCRAERLVTFYNPVGRLVRVIRQRVHASEKTQFGAPYEPTWEAPMFRLLKKKQWSNAY